MAAAELEEPHVVAQLPELASDPPSAGLDRQDRVPGSMGHEEPGRTPTNDVGDEARGERDDAGEQIAVREPQRQRVARAIGESADGYAGGIDVLTPEHLLQCPVNEFDIGTEP